METFPSSYAAGIADEARAQIKDKMVARGLFGQPDRAFNVHEDLRLIPKFAQTQRALDEQLADLRAIANRLGLYDAADYIQFEQREAR